MNNEIRKTIEALADRVEKLMVSVGKEELSSDEVFKELDELRLILVSLQG